MLGDEYKAFRLTEPAYSDVPVWEVSLQGKRLTAKILKNHPSHSHFHRRKEITEFSRSSRLRLLKNIAIFDWSRIGKSLFVTLTYPDEVLHFDAMKRNQEKYLFHRFAESHTGKHLSGVWRVEWLPRKSGEYKGIIAPHVHLLFFGLGYIEHAKACEAWKSILHHDGRISVWLEDIPPNEVVSLYVSKYCGKVSESLLGNATYLNNVRGRHYGYLRSKQIPRCEKSVVVVQDRELSHWLQVRAGARLKYLDLDCPQSFTLLGEYAAKVGKDFFEKVLTSPSTPG